MRKMTGRLLNDELICLGEFPPVMPVTFMVRTISENTKKLHEAAKNGQITVVKSLIKKTGVNSRDNSKCTALHFAAQNGHCSVVKHLIQNGAEVNVKQEENWTPLHCAAENGHHDVVRHLIENGAEVDANQGGNWTPLYFAAKNGHKDIIKLLIDKGANLTQLITNENQCNCNATCIMCIGPRNGTFAFMPCGHSVACEPCCGKLLLKKPVYCPYCRTPITHYQKIFVQGND